LRSSVRRAFVTAANDQTPSMAQDDSRIAGAELNHLGLDDQAEALNPDTHTLAHHHTTRWTTIFNGIFLASDNFVLFLDLAYDLRAGSFLQLPSILLSLCIDGWLLLSPFSSLQRREKVLYPHKSAGKHCFYVGWKPFTDCCFDTNV